MHWPSLFLRAHPKRAVLESLMLGIVSWIVLLLLQHYLPSFIWRISIGMCIGIGCVLLCALRLQLPEGEKRQQGLFEVTTGGALSLLLASMELLVTLVLLQAAATNELWHGLNRPLWLAAIALMLDFAMFLLFRMGVRLWLFWDQLRRKQLVWALTYAHVLVMLLLTGLLLVILEILLIAHFSDVFLVVSTTLGLLIVSVIAFIAIVPPSILFSYLVMRHTTQRVKTLATATSAIRGGNYGIRVQVLGEDEVAQLQADFNAMATDLERSMRELREERDRVTELLQARRELIASVSHELRTPVATLRSSLETTLMHWDERSISLLHHDFHVMEHEVMHLQILIEDLFTLARAEVGPFTFRLGPTDVGKLVRDIVETTAPVVWRLRKIDVVAEVPSELPDILGDSNRIKQVVQNLIHNAVRHTSPGGIVAIQILVESEAVLIRVRDTGEGIAFVITHFRLSVNLSEPACFLVPISASSQVQLRELRYACIEEGKSETCAHASSSKPQGREQGPSLQRKQPLSSPAGKEGIHKGVFSMSTEDNKAFVRRFYEEVHSKKNLAAVDDFIDPNIVDHAAPPGLPGGIEGARQFAGMLLTAFPDHQVTVEDMIAEGDKVVARLTVRGTHQGAFLGIPPTGKHWTFTAIDIIRIAGGKIVEHWNNYDALGLMQQLGVVPSMG